jgi:GNAT superfamily N-acetyltransferase
VSALAGRVEDAPPPVIRFADDADEVAACFPLMRMLRPHLASATELVERWRRQSEAGYRLLVAWDGDSPVALAGFRIEENLVHGRFLYVDDLVTAEGNRSAGHGGRMMQRLRDEGRRLGLGKIVLDTPLANVLGHRFYYRNGLLATALRFSMALS